MELSEVTRRRHVKVFTEEAAKCVSRKHGRPLLLLAEQITRLTDFTANIQTQTEL